jgi:hypothetical protein
MAVQAFALLCALAAVTCSASATRAIQLWYWPAGALPGIVLFNPAWLALPFAAPLAIEPAQSALLLVLLAGASLRGAVSVAVLLSAGGLLSVLWLQVLLSLAWPLPLALPLVLVCVLLAMFCKLRRPGFCPVDLHEEALVILLVAALALALVPDLVRGWSTALGLQAVGADGNAETGNAGVLWVAAGFVVFGAVFAQWQYRRVHRSRG